jgi:hypothetical protein
VRLNNSPTSSPVKRAPGGGSVHGFAQLPAMRVPAMAFEEVMQGVFSAGAMLAAEPRLRASREHGLLRASLAWWLDNKPEVRGWRWCGWAGWVSWRKGWRCLLGRCSSACLPASAAGAAARQRRRTCCWQQRRLRAPPRRR